MPFSGQRRQRYPFQPLEGEILSSPPIDRLGPFTSNVLRAGRGTHRSIQLATLYADLISLDLNMSNYPITLFSIASLLLISGTFANGTVWRVDDDGPADFGDIQDAIDAASQHDTILIHPGSYSAFSICISDALT